MIENFEKSELCRTNFNVLSRLQLCPITFLSQISAQSWPASSRSNRCESIALVFPWKSFIVGRKNYRSNWQQVCAILLTHIIKGRKWYLADNPEEEKMFHTSKTNRPEGCNERLWGFSGEKLKGIFLDQSLRQFWSPQGHFEDCQLDLSLGSSHLAVGEATLQIYPSRSRWSSCQIFSSQSLHTFIQWFTVLKTTT